MKKVSKTTLRNKLDKLCFLFVSSKGKCDRCKGTNCLQTAHIFSRKFNNTRWDIDTPNLLCLCAACHRWGHDNPILFTEWVRKFLGEERYDLLKEKHNQITKFTVEDLQLKLKVLTELTEGKG